MRLGAVPSAVLSADERGGTIRVHSETRCTVEADVVAVGEVTAESDTISWNSRISTVYN